MPDFTSVFTQERDHWRDRAEAAEAEVERLRGALDRAEAVALKLGGAAGQAICAALAVRRDDQ